MIGKKGPFPELDSLAGKQPSEDNGFIGSSQAVGAGHEDYDGRDAIKGTVFPNTESGEGKTGVPSKEGRGL